MSNTLKIHYKGLLPDLFREGQGIVAEGRMGPDGVFVASEVLAKHDENYMPPEAADGGAASDTGKEQGGAPQQHLEEETQQHLIQPQQQGRQHKQAQGQQAHRLRVASVAFLTTRTLNAAVATASAAIQRRHLMVWALFAPKFLFDACILLVCDVVVLAGVATALAAMRT